MSRLAAVFVLFSIFVSQVSHARAKSVCNYGAGQSIALGSVTSASYTGCSFSSSPLPTELACSCSTMITQQFYACINSDGTTSESGTLTIAHHGSWTVNAISCGGNKTYKEDPTDTFDTEIYGKENIEERDFEPAPIIEKGVKK